MDLSIIIPTFNAHKMIEKALNSIKIQKTNFSFEVIIVNDSSDKDYSEFITKYKKYYNIREIKTKKNLGPGGARQLGIGKSSSKYIVFMDSDDYFYQSNSLYKMYNAIVEKDADVLIGNFIYERDNKILVKKKNLVWLHGKIYKREFLEKNKIKFNNSRANEDNGFNRLILLLSPKIYFLNEIVYVYKDNENSITRKNNRAYKLDGLEGFCYNMNWAMNEALMRGTSERVIFLLTLNILGTLYFYYLNLENEFNVDKIIIWSKSIKDKYDKLKNKYPNEKIDLEAIKNNLKDEICLRKKQSLEFSEFLMKYDK